MIPQHLIVKKTLIFLCLVAIVESAFAQTSTSITPSQVRRQFLSPPPAASPWVFWYWLNGAVSKQGITADLEAMKQVGIGGAYLMPIKDTVSPPLITPSSRQLSPQWYAMLNHTMREAKRLNLKIGMHVSDGFALAGGPWITPALSMQKLVWARTTIQGGSQFNDTLPTPEMQEGYYKDIAVYAYPSPEGSGNSTRTIKPIITSSKPDTMLSLLVDPLNKKTFGCDDQCWIQYEFKLPFTCRSIIIRSRNNYQVNRLKIEVSNDGKSFRSATRLEAPRHGWQDWDANYTHAIPAVTAKYFRFIYDKEGSEPGAEDLDAAKWKPSFKLTGIELSSEAIINQYEGKNGEVWRIGKQTMEQQAPADLCVPIKNIINLTSKLNKNGQLVWEVPPGNWTLLRIGHTSTGHKNDTGGGGKGLECDKFNPEAITLQFNNWFGAFYKQVDPALIHQVLKVFHVDSWECGSQNWSPVFQSEFKKRRGYDILQYLPIVAGLPVESADFSERFLHDIRKTIAELVADNFYVTLARLAHKKGCTFTAESVAPTMLSDGMLHYKNVDIPMGEFWLRSPTHDKPNDMLDAISGAHVYGKNIIQAEAFTELRMQWDEHPGMLKTLLDRNYALGINKVVYHVFMHNPWMDRKPGVTLDAIGLYFQRDQTWWKQGKAWVDYAKRCQALLQLGKPVTDIAVFTGEELPRRAVLPDRLVNVMPAMFDDNLLKLERERMFNKGQPIIQSPPGVTHSANMTEPADWADALNGYAYDSFNPDALIRLAKVQKGRIVLPGGAKYSMLVLPGNTAMSPNAELMGGDVSIHLKKLIEEGATIYSRQLPEKSMGVANVAINNKLVKNLADSLSQSKLGNGRIIQGAVTPAILHRFGIEKDFIANDVAGNSAEGIAWCHRADKGLDIYFVSNQDSVAKTLNLSLRVTERLPELYDAVSGNIRSADNWHYKNGRTLLPIELEPNGSVFIVLQQADKNQSFAKAIGSSQQTQTLPGNWTVDFAPASGGPLKPVVFNELIDWSKHSDSAIRYHSGTAAYAKTFTWNSSITGKKILLNIGKVGNLAEVFVNGINCGIAWTPPFSVDITKAIKQGENKLRIDVVNTLANRLIGDHRLPAYKRITNTLSPDRLEGKPLLPAGLFGPVTIQANLK